MANGANAVKNQQQDVWTEKFKFCVLLFAKMSWNWIYLFLGTEISLHCFELSNYS
jgi:hypothetical protein